MMEELLKLKHSPPSRHTNYLLIPVNIINITREGAEKFNKLYFYIKSLDLPPLERTPSGGIQNGRKAVRPAWDITTARNSVELTVLLPEGSWRIQFRTKLPEGLSGKKAFTNFKNMLLKRGIDLDDYAVENGKEIKKEIESPLIGAKRESFYDIEFSNVHHIDFHSSFPAGLANTHPEFRPILEEIYQRREEKEIYKNILNFSIGFMQSIRGCKAKYAVLARDAINDNNARVKNLAHELEKHDRIILLFNTDGIWYQGPIYHGRGEGDNLGEWRNDHINCIFRAKSAGAYEFIENGVYCPIVRGISSEAKDGWKWGDIYSEKANPDKFIFTEEEGIKIDG